MLVVLFNAVKVESVPLNFNYFPGDQVRESQDRRAHAQFQQISPMSFTITEANSGKAS